MEEASGSNSQGTQLFSREQQQWLASFIGGITRGHFPSLGSVISIHCYYADSWFSMTIEVMNIITRSQYN